MSLVFEMTSFPDFAKNVTTIIVSMLIGIALAAVISLFHRYYFGSFIRFLLKGNAIDPESGIRLDRTVYGKRLFLLRAISNGNLFRNVLRYTEPEEPVSISSGSSHKQKRLSKKADLLTRKYYIPEELTYRADNLFNKKGTNFIAAVVGIIIFSIIAGICLVLIPDLITMFNNFINGL